MWAELLSALALVLVIEGIMPFVAPGGWRDLMAKLCSLDDRALRNAGLTSMVIGVVLLYFVRM